MKKFLKKVAAGLPAAKFTRFRNRKIFEWMNQHAAEKRVLNLGSGVKQFDHYLNNGINPVHLDIDRCKPNLDIVADAHELPFCNECFDIVFSIAVLEHVKRPWIVAEEITRILKPGGHVILEIPFLNVIHDEEDYFRFTDKGIEILFDQDHYDVILRQVGSGGASFMSVFLHTYFQQFMPGKYGKFFWSITMRYPFAMIKYIDFLIDRSPTMRLTANSFSFIGQKK
jgi:SAM-dependent methyltransferase